MLKLATVGRRVLVPFWGPTIILAAVSKTKFEKK
jgi:hypothetical protein